jgi:stage V sporulation protein D (sporulation-specific penicillin-binding protein)
MWNNKITTEMFEPGSTFKIITSSIALEEKKVSVSEGFFCSGSFMIEGYGRPVHCHKVVGHGSVTFAQGLQQSCNPVLMTIAARVGTNAFFNYYEDFGYIGKTGIDLPGEQKGVFHKLENFHNVELAIASFGQRFKVTALQQITGISAVANGGYVVTPHLMKELVDDNGNVIETYKTEAKRQVISKETCDILAGILEEGVSGNGGAKNAYVAGYKVAAKTGTSQKFDDVGTAEDTNLRIGSCIAFAPADDPQIAVYVVVDEPMNGSVYGSVVAAPYVSNILKAVLPYLGIEPQYTEAELAKLEVNVSQYVGMTVADAKSAISKSSLACEIIGDGEKVTRQIPEAGGTFAKNTGKIILYAGSTEAPQTSVVPNVMGKTAAAANQMLVNTGLNVKIEGAQNYASGSGAVVISQSPPAASKVERGSVVTITLRHMDGTD